MEHLQREQQLGGYEAAEQAADAIDNFYTAMAALLNARPSEIAWMENSTRAWDMAFHAVDFQPGDRIVTGQTEYASNLLAMLHMQRRRGVEIIIIPNDAEGRIDLEQLERSVDDRVRLICLTHVASQQGVVQPAAEVGAIAARHGILFLLDACQSAGQIPIDVRQTGCHLLTGSGRKYLRGPRGTGFLYVSSDVTRQLEPPFIDLRAASWVDESDFRIREDAARFENWEAFVAGKIGLAAAVDYALALGMPVINRRIATLAASLRHQLAAMAGVTVYEPLDEATGIVTFSVGSLSPEKLQAALRRSRINIGVSRKATAQVDFSRRGLTVINRASVHYYNTGEEIDRLLAAIAESAGN